MNWQSSIFFFFLKIWRSIIRLIYITLDDDGCCTINFLLKDPLCLAFSSFLLLCSFYNNFFFKWQWQHKHTKVEHSVFFVYGMLDDWKCILWHWWKHYLNYRWCMGFDIFPNWESDYLQLLVWMFKKKVPPPLDLWQQWV